jgi:phosphatidylglycerophosphatase A
VVAFLLVLLVVGVEAARVAFAFLLFRLFDIVKLPPASIIDREWHHGFGVMADDIVAAFYALIVFAIVQRIFL